MIHIDSVSWFDAFQRNMNVIFTDKDFNKYRKTVRSNLHFYKKYLKNDAKILYVGCGLGVTSIPLSTLGYQIIGIDNDSRVVEAASINAKKYGKNIKIIQGDVFNIDQLFDINSFDACISGGLLEHFSEKQISVIIQKQLIVAPLVAASMPIASYQSEVWNDGIVRNLWDKKYWLNNILNKFNVVEFKIQTASESIRGFKELEVVIKRQKTS